jgi:hypothetical protein
MTKEEISVIVNQCISQAAGCWTEKPTGIWDVDKAQKLINRLTVAIELYAKTVVDQSRLWDSDYMNMGPFAHGNR